MQAELPQLSGKALSKWEAEVVHLSSKALGSHWIHTLQVPFSVDVNMLLYGLTQE